MTEDLLALFSDLTRYDTSVAIEADMVAALKRRRVRATPYSRESMFSAMSNGEIRLFERYPMHTNGDDDTDAGTLVRRALKGWRSRQNLRVRCGPSCVRKYMTVRELIDRWDSGRGILCITDLHIRKSRIESVVDPAALSWFNLLPECGGEAAVQEMMTMVVSSRGSVSDSHSDAPDGSNHCFQGRKLWLMWDTFEGMDLGMEDVSRNDVTTYSSFDMHRFLKMRSARWLLISPGQTLFLPGDYTHKVITIEKYLGVGSFYVSLPNSLRTLSRWILHRPVWLEGDSEGQHDEIVKEITQVARDKVDRLKRSGSRLRRTYGYDYLAHSVQSWSQATPTRQRNYLRSVPLFQQYFDLVANECLAAANV